MPNMVAVTKLASTQLFKADEEIRLLQILLHDRPDNVSRRVLQWRDRAEDVVQRAQSGAIGYDRSGQKNRRSQQNSRDFELRKAQSLRFAVVGGEHGMAKEPGGGDPEQVSLNRPGAPDCGFNQAQANKNLQESDPLTCLHRTRNC